MNSKATLQIPEIYRREIVWDAHACMPLESGLNMSDIERYRESSSIFVAIDAAWISIHSDRLSP